MTHPQLSSVLPEARVARTSKPTAVSTATSIVVGLVAVTPVAGYVGPMSALILEGYVHAKGAAAGV
jgi:ammonia channel protein AmtB